MAAAGALRGSRRAVIVAGGGVHFSGATEALRDFAARHALPVVETQAGLHKRIALELVFLSPALQQMDHKADFIPTRMFEVLRDRYIEGTGSRLHLMPAGLESEIEKSDDKAVRGRLVCDWVASMTDSFAFRTYRRLFDADFGSITDFV